MTTVLEQICAMKADHIALQKTRVDVSLLKDKVEQSSATLGFINALRGRTPALIAEVKKASPSRGVIRENFDPVEIAETYAANGAACLSVLTDEPYFQGHDQYLVDIRKSVSIPLLRKDFMLDPYQVWEARALGADCILLIMAALEDDRAAELYALATSLGLDALFEVHDETELTRALALSPSMVGVNNRNLKTLEVDIENGLRLAAMIPDGVIKVAESGIGTHSDLRRFQDAGFDAFLIGESLMREADLGAATRKILGGI